MRIRGIIDIVGKIAHKNDLLSCGYINDKQDFLIRELALWRSSVAKIENINKYHTVIYKIQSLLKVKVYYCI